MLYSSLQISVKVRSNKAAGLGSLTAGEGSMSDIEGMKKRQQWLQMQQRFIANDEDEKATTEGTKEDENKPADKFQKNWVQGDSEKMS